MINPFQKNSADSSLLEDPIAPWMGPLAPWSRQPIVDKDDRARNWFAICVAVSILLHILLLMIYLPQKKMGEEPPLAAGPIAVSLEPVKPHKAEPKQPEPQPEPPRQSIIASRKPPTAAKPIYVPPPPDKPQPVRPPVQQPTPEPPEDFMAQASRNRAARQAAEDEAARENAVARGQDGRSPDQVIGDNLKRSLNPHKGGNGIFEVKFPLGVRSGSLKFHGWHPGANDDQTHTYEVDVGQGGDVRMGIVRKMIEIIRSDYKETDFTWDSRRLGHPVSKSSRVADNAELERFLMQEMFDDPTEAPQPRRR